MVTAYIALGRVQRMTRDGQAATVLDEVDAHGLHRLAGDAATADLPLPGPWSADEPLVLSHIAGPGGWQHGDDRQLQPRRRAPGLCAHHLGTKT
jgi:hypothetical protein